MRNRDFRIRRRVRGALRILMVLATAIVTVGVSPAASSETEAGRASIESEGVSATFAVSDRRLAEHVLAAVIEERDAMALRFPAADLEHVVVDVASSAEEFAELSYGGVPDWGVGCAILAERRIIVRSPREARVPYDLRTVLRHEIAHIAVSDVLGAVRAPRWFHEGAASAAAGEWRLEESAALAVGAWRGTLLLPSELERGFPENARQARLAYAESYQAILLLEKLGGADDVAELVGMIAREPSFDIALRRMTGADRVAFDALLLQRLRERFGLALLMRRGNLLFVASGVLVLIGAFLKWRRSRVRLAQWEREERRGDDAAGGVGGSWR